MSIFLPYSPSVVIAFFTDLFSFDLSSLTDYQELCLTIWCNAYFFLHWFFILYFAIKIFNRIWERLF